MTLNLGSWGRKMSQNMIEDKEKQKMKVYMLQKQRQKQRLPHMVSISVWTIEE